MTETTAVLKKLQFKDKGQPVLILNAPKAYEEVMSLFEGEVHIKAEQARYEFVQAFGTTNGELQSYAKLAASAVIDNGLLWLCYPKKSSKVYKGSDCSRETVMYLLADEGYEPVRQVAIDEDWSALRFRNVDEIKTMKRNFAVTDKGKERTEQADSTK